MADQPYKVQIDYKQPENVEAEVPRSQELREAGTSSDGSVIKDTATEGTVTEITDDFTLSPVITVTKKEATFTKGDLKLQKVTVTEDIAIEETQNGSTIRRKYTSSIVRDGDTVTRSTSATDDILEDNKDDKQHDEKKSKIPMLKFRQTVEKVKKQRRSRQKEEIEKRPRKSSIPRLKDSRTKPNETPKTTLATEDEFDKIYGEIINEEEMNIDDKVLAVKVEDPEKLESKFEELIHSYEQDDGGRYTEIVRVSKIPALRRRKADDGAKLSSIVNNIRLQNAVRKSKEFTNEDDFGEVTTRTITTKRYGRIQSREDSSVTMEIDTCDNVTKEVIGNSDIKSGDIKKKVVKTERVIKESKSGLPVLSKVTHNENITIMDRNDYDNAENSTVNVKQVTKSERIVTKGTTIQSEPTNKDNKNITGETSTLKKSLTIVKETKNSSPVVTNTTITNVDTKNDVFDLNQDDTNTKVISTHTIVRESSVESPIASKIPTITNYVNVEKKIDTNQSTSNRKNLKNLNLVKATSVETPIATQVTKLGTKDQSTSETEVVITQKIIRESSVDKPAVTKGVTITKLDNADGNNYLNQGGTKTEFVNTRQIVRGNSTEAQVTEKLKTIANVESSHNKFDMSESSSNTKIIKSQRIVRESSIETPVTKLDTKDNYIDSNQYANESRVIETQKITRERSVDTPLLVTEVVTTAKHDKNQIKHGNTELENTTTEIVEKDMKTVTTVTTSTVTTGSTKDGKHSEIATKVTNAVITMNNNTNTNNKESTEITKVFSNNTTTNISKNGEKRKDLVTKVINKCTNTSIDNITNKNNEVLTIKPTESSNITIIPKIDKHIVEGDPNVESAVSESVQHSLITNQVIRAQSQENQNIPINKLIQTKGIETVTTNYNDTMSCTNDKSSVSQEGTENKVSITTEVTETMTDVDRYKISPKIYIKEDDKSENQPSIKKEVSVTTVIKTVNSIDGVNIDNTSSVNKEAITQQFTKTSTADNITSLLVSNIADIQAVDKIVTNEKASVNEDYISKSNSKSVTNTMIDINKTSIEDKTIKIDNIIASEINTKDDNNTTPDKDKDGEIMILKGNVSRLINKMGSKNDRVLNTNNGHAENKDNQETSAALQIDDINRERVKRLDKMISDFNKVDYKTMDTKTLIERETEDSVVNTPDNNREGVTILKGNVSRLIRNMDIITKNDKDKVDDSYNAQVSDYKDTFNNEQRSKFEYKHSNSNISVTKKDNYNVELVGEKEVIDTNDLTADRDRNTNVCTSKTEVKRNISQETTYYDVKTTFMKETANKTTAIQNKDYNTNIIADFSMKEIVGNVVSQNNKSESNYTSQKESTDTTAIMADKIRSSNNTIYDTEMSDKTVAMQEKNCNTGEISIRGNVNRSINKITTREHSADEKYAKDYEDEFPQKKMVLSKIAIFESLEPKEPHPIPRHPRTENKLSKVIVKDIHIEKPRIVEEVRKDIIKLQPDGNDENNNDAVTTVNHTINESLVKDQEKLNLIFENTKGSISVTTINKTIEKPLKNEPHLYLRGDNNKYSITETGKSTVGVPLLPDQTEFGLNKDINRDIITVISGEDVTRKEPFIVNEVWKTNISEDRNMKNISVTQTVRETNFSREENGSVIQNMGVQKASFNTYDNKVENSTSSIDNNTNDIQRHIYFMTNKDNVQISSTIDNASATESPVDIYERVRNRYNVYEQNAMSISKEIKKTKLNEFKLNDNTYNVESSITTADITDNKFDYTVHQDDDPKSVKVDRSKLQNLVSDETKLSPKETFVRAQSLAENDIGEVVKGQVNNIVVRMRSVDVGHRSESGNMEKISPKEMPKRSSVLEKIALFEGKAVRARMEPSSQRTPPIIRKCVRERWTREGQTVQTTTEVVKPVEQQVTTQGWSEERYQEIVAELANATSMFGCLAKMPKLTLADGSEMPVLALGTALLEPSVAPHVVSAAIAMGYRAIDTAYIYGNEKEVGTAIQAKIADGTVKREELFIMSKLWSTFHRPDLVEGACRASLNALGLTNFDLYMIHNPMSFKEGGDPIPRIATVLQYSASDYLDAWRGMEQLKAKGLTRALGLSNFNSAQIQRILDKGRIKPVVNQVECHPYLSQQRLHEFCAARNITLSCFGVLGSKGTPDAYKSSLASAIDDPLIQVMAKGLNVTPAQLLIRYQLQYERNVVVKSSSAAHLWDNLQALNFSISTVQMEAIRALNRNKRTFTFAGMGDTHKNYPFLAPF